MNPSVRVFSPFLLTWLDFPEFRLPIFCLVGRVPGVTWRKNPVSFSLAYNMHLVTVPYFLCDTNIITCAS